MPKRRWEDFLVPVWEFGVGRTVLLHVARVCELFLSLHPPQGILLTSPSRSGPSSASPLNSTFHIPSTAVPTSATASLLPSRTVQSSLSSSVRSTRSSRRSRSQQPSSTSSSSSLIHRPPRTLRSSRSSSSTSHPLLSRSSRSSYLPQ